MAIDVFFGFDSNEKDDGQWIDRILAYKQGKAAGIPVALIKRIKHSGVGEKFVAPLAQQMTAGQPYSASQLAGLLGTGWNKKKSAINAQRDG